MSTERPTQTEWGVRYNDGRVNGPTTHATALYLSTRDGNVFPVVRREVTDWYTADEVVSK